MGLGVEDLRGGTFKSIRTQGAYEMFVTDRHLSQIKKRNKPIAEILEVVWGATVASRPKSIR